MDRDDDYRKKAAEAEKMADRTVSAVANASWLRVAQGWLSLIRKPQQTAKDSVKRKDTGQD